MSEIITLKNLNVKNFRTSQLPDEKNGNDLYDIMYNKKPLRLKIAFLTLDHPYSGILDSRKVNFKTKKINPLYVYFRNGDENTKKLKRVICPN